MKIPKYWAKGSTDILKQRNPKTGKIMGQFACWGWSDISLADAEKTGEERASKFAKLFRDKKLPSGDYAYSDRPIREEILDKWFHKNEDTPYAMITRNSMGCQVMNTSDAMFIDVDLTLPSFFSELSHKIKIFFGKSEIGPVEQLRIAALSSLRELATNDPSFGVRIYQTRAGLRYLITHLHGAPCSDTTDQIMSYLGADPLYMRLCKMQECFRARLSPKPYRCGMQRLGLRYPWTDTEAKTQVQNWLKDYHSKIETYATCKFLEHLGNPVMSPAFEKIVKFHDKECKTHSQLPLA